MENRRSKLVSLANNVAQVGSHLAQKAYVDGCELAGNKADGLQIVSVLLSGGLTCMAACVHANPKSLGPEACMNRDTILLAALLVAATTEKPVGFDDSKGTYIAANWTPEAVLEAYENFEKITGRKPDTFASKGLSKWARECDPAKAKDASDALLNALMQNHSNRGEDHGSKPPQH